MELQVVLLTTILAEASLLKGLTQDTIVPSLYPDQQELNVTYC